VEALARDGSSVSIDTSKAVVAEAALDAGASMVNDVTALRSDPELAAVCAKTGCELVLMHMLGDPRTMQENPVYDDVVDDIRAFLAERIEYAVSEGVAEERIWVDPGIASARPSSTTSSFTGGSVSSRSSAGRSPSAHPARASSAGSPVQRSISDRRNDRSNVIAYANGARCSGSTTSPRCARRLTVAAAFSADELADQRVDLVGRS